MVEAAANDDDQNNNDCICCVEWHCEFALLACIASPFGYIYLLSELTVAYFDLFGRVYQTKEKEKYKEKKYHFWKLVFRIIVWILFIYYFHFKHEVLFDLFEMTRIQAVLIMAWYVEYKLIFIIAVLTPKTKFHQHIGKRNFVETTNTEFSTTCLSEFRWNKFRYGKTEYFYVTYLEIICFVGSAFAWWLHYLVVASSSLRFIVAFCLNYHLFVCSFASLKRFHRARILFYVLVDYLTIAMIVSTINVIFWNSDQILYNVTFANNVFIGLKILIYFLDLPI